MIVDWTGLCEDEEAVKEINFQIDKNNNLYIATSKHLHVASLNNLIMGNSPYRRGGTFAVKHALDQQLLSSGV